MNHSRIRWLVVAHAVLAVGPLLVLGLERSIELVPLEWILSSLPLGILMTLSVWVGLGRPPLLWRAAIGLTAVFYLTIFPMIVDITHAAEHLTVTEWILKYLEMTMELDILLVLLSGAFLLVGRRFEIVGVKSEYNLARNERLQFSMLQVILLMSAVAIVLSLMRATRAVFGHRSSAWEAVIIYSFMFVAFLVNTVCAAFATLGTGKVWRNVASVLVVAVLLGVATAIAMHHDTLNWWLFGGSMLIMIVPTVVVLASLLVVRSCGYRLIRRGSETTIGLV